MFVLPADVACRRRHSAKLGIDTQFNGADWAMHPRPHLRPDRSDLRRRPRVPGDGHAEPDADRGHGAVHRRQGVRRRRGRVITAPQVLIAAGSRPIVPPISGLVETGFHTSDSIMRLDCAPATARDHRRRVHRRRDGTRVRRPRFGGDAVRPVEHDAARLRPRHRRTLHGAVRHARRPPSRARTDGGPPGRRTASRSRAARRSIVVDELLVATGREPNTDLLDAACGGIELARSRHGS